MRRLTVQGRARALAPLTAVAGLCLAGTVVGTGTAQSAEPTGDCKTAYPVDDLVRDQAVTGLTVTHGTTPEGFSGKVLGVLNDGIAAGVDMVMVDLTSPAIDEIGIWEGMSGSPVYAEDGRLIGAVSYGLSTGASQVAGVTPFSAMQDYLAPTGTVDVGRAEARVIARSTSVSAADARQGFEPLPTPLGVAGVGARQLARAENRAGDRGYLPRSTYALGKAAATDAGADTITAGGNLAASLTYGDITMAGVGTTTSVCNGRVVGFGHPMEYTGRTTLSMHPADAIYVQPDLIAGFKVVNIGDPVGTITDDRGAGISGVLGTRPSTARITSTVAFRHHERTGTSHVSVRTPDALASTAFYEILANHQSVVDGPVVGSEEASWVVRGTGPDGARFRLASTNRYSSHSDLVWDVGFDTGDLVYVLERLPGVRIDSVTTDARVTRNASSYSIVRLEQRRNGAWKQVTTRKPLTAPGGGRLNLRAVLSAPAGETTVPVHLDVPKRMAGHVGMLEVSGGANVRSFRGMKSLADARKAVRNLVRNDEIQVSLTGGPRVSDDTRSGSVGRPRAGTVHQTVVLGPFDKVVKDRRAALVVVR